MTVLAGMVAASIGFLIAALALHGLNDKVEERLTGDDLGQSIRSIVDKGYKDKVERVLAVIDVGMAEVKIKTKLSVSNWMAFISSILSFLPMLILVASPQSLIISIIEELYGMSATLLLIAYALNRLSDRTSKRIPKLRAA